MEFETSLYGDCSVEEIKRGYREEEEYFVCILCGERFFKGEIYPFNGRLYEASRAVQIHIHEKHYSVEKFLLGMKAGNMGLSDLQLQILNFFSTGISDKEIADYLGVSGSTVRNHRFKLREREKQSRLFIALMELLEGEESGVKTKKKPIALEGYRINEKAEEEITNKEKRKVIERYMTPMGRLKTYPSYEKSKKIILEMIIQNFSIGKKYNEKEINEELEKVYRDYHLLKEELITYDFLGRSNKGGIYWVKDYRRRA